jgi:hypothetical protein
VGYADHHIYTAGGSSEHRINLSGNLHKATTSYTPSASRPYFNFFSGTEKVSDDGTNFYEDAAEAPSTSGWAAPYTTWTPELWDNTNSDASATYTIANTVGKYLRMGNLVYIEGRVDMLTIAGLNGTHTANIGNLPYQPIGVGPINIGYSFGLALSSATSLSGLISTSQKKFSLWAHDLTSGGSNLTITEFSATGDIMFSGWYFTDDAVKVSL